MAEQGDTALIVGQIGRPHDGPDRLADRLGGTKEFSRALPLPHHSQHSRQTIQAVGDAAPVSLVAKQFEGLAEQVPRLAAVPAPERDIAEVVALGPEDLAFLRTFPPTLSR
jgi:hypothetical protein